VKQQAIQIIERIFKVERYVHRAKHLHLHELADADTLLDICGALIAIEYLGIEKIISRPLKAGKGFKTISDDDEGKPKRGGWTIGAEVPSVAVLCEEVPYRMTL